jgi:hypothetical protein
MLLINHLEYYMGGTIEEFGFDARQEQDVSPLLMSRPALGPTQSCIRGVQQAVAPRVEWPEHEADHFYVVPYSSTPPYLLIAQCLTT